MSITHEVFLFDPSQFATDVLPYVTALKQGAGRQKIQEAALERFEQSPVVRTIALEASWDVWSVYEGLELEEPSGPIDIAKWLVFLLYDHLVPVPTHLSLIKWWLLGDILRELNWHDTDRSLLIHGHSFGYFAQVWIVDKSGTDADAYQGDNLEYWEHLRPITTLAQIGWLDKVDVERLLAKLTRDRSRLLGINLPHASSAGVDQNSIRETYETALGIIRHASRATTGLCLLTSG